MGGGSFDSRVYYSAAASRKASGTSDFAYSDETMRMAREKRKAHETLDATKIIQGVKGVRESRDSADHPETTPVMVFFDVTGSMRGTPPIFQKKLEKLMSTLLLKTVLEHPHVLVGAIGDVTCDSVPLQVSQFESDNRIDEQLRNIVLEGGGGDGQHESYELALYFASRLTALDSLEKRGKKGYMFIIGDEVSYLNVTRDAVSKVFGISEQSDIPLDTILNEVMEKFDIYFIMPSGTNHWKKVSIMDFWKAKVGQNFLMLENPEAICELIASTIALNEGSTMEEINNDMKQIGLGEAMPSVSMSLANYVVDASRVSTRTAEALPTSGNTDTIKTL
jgi:hypothetical protein